MNSQLISRFSSVSSFNVPRLRNPFNFGILFVPEQESWVVQQLGRYHKILKPGLQFLIPFVHKVAYRHSLKEIPIQIKPQTAITKDNVGIHMDGVLYVQIDDAYKASYNISNPYEAIIQLAVATMRSEIGKIPLDKTFEERELLNAKILVTINQATDKWGIKCMRYEIKDINPPQSVVKAMELQVAAERDKRAVILESEGKKEAKINNAIGDKANVTLASEAEAQSILNIANAKAAGITKIAEAMNHENGDSAIKMKIAEDYIKSFAELGKTSNTIMLPTSASDPNSIIAQAMTIYNTLNK